MNHSWKDVKGKPVKGQISHKECKHCFLQVRRVRKGSERPRGGWIVVQLRTGKGPWSLPHRGTTVPQCEACRDCPTCKGTGRITRRQYKEMQCESG